MSCKDGSSGGKWPCNMCTYLNYSSAGRCTMCGTVRPQDLIMPPNAPAAATTTGDTLHCTGADSVSDDMITLPDDNGDDDASNVVAASPPAPPPPALPSNTAGDKWACSQCTYLNFPRTLRCSQCYTLQASNAAASPEHPSVTAACPPALRSPSSQSPQHTSRATQSPQPFINSQSQHHISPIPKVSSSPTHKSRQSPALKSRLSPPLKARQSPPLKSRQSPPLKLYQSSPKGRRSPPRQFSPKQSIRLQSSPKVYAKNRVNHETQTSPCGPADQHLVSHKWCCPACTYENWPRSVRCIMCATPKRAHLDSSGNNGAPDACKKSPPPFRQIGENSQCNLNSRSCTSGSVSDDHLIESESSSSKSIDISGIARNLSSCTNTSDERTDKDLQNIFNVSDHKETKTCESINLINRNRSESCLNNQEGVCPTTSAVNSVSVSVVSSIADVLTSSSSIISCSTALNHPTHGATVASSPHSTPSSGTNSSSAATQASNNSRDVSSDTGVGGRGEGAVALNNCDTERLMRHLRRTLRATDLAFLNACLAVVEGNYEPVEMYLSSGGDPMRQLTSTDVKLLARPSAFDEGHTLVHLAIRFGREDLLHTILSGIDGGACGGVKRVPCYVAPELATDIRRAVAASLRQRREPFPCYCVSEFVTYSLPPEVETLGSTSAQDRLWDELLDRDAQKQLEEDAPIINWSLELTDRLGSRLYALWNRTAGDCLLDSVLQSTWGVFDRDNCLRRALAASITDAAHLLYPRWKEYERLQATMLDYAVPENQVLEEWGELVCLASQPGAALDQLHIFVLAHILRRPVIVYGVKCVKSFRGEDLGYARFEGVYLPLLWDSSFCCKSPIALGYTRGHFCALVPICPQSIHTPSAGAILDPGESQLVFLPLMSHDGKLLPVHFITQAEVGCETSLLRGWLDVCQSETGLLVAQQKLHKKPLPVAQMTEEWLNYYRTMAQMEGAPFARPITSQGYSSDGDSEEE